MSITGKLRGLALVAVTLLLVGVCSADEIAIPIINPSFEVPVVGQINGWAMYLDGWYNYGNAGVWQPSPDLLTVTDGVNAAWIWSGYISQVLTTTLAASSNYNLAVDVGWRSDMGAPQYMIQLLAGGVVLAQDSTSAQPTAGTFATANLSYSSGASGPLIGQALEIRLYNLGSSQAQFDNVRLTDPPSEVPEPATLALFGSGLVGLAAMFRRRRR
jgi:hypothetical protein